MKRKEIEEVIGCKSAAGLEKLEELAAKKGLEVWVRAIGKKPNDFTIFIYDKSVKDTYMVGFDGHFRSEFICTFPYCLRQAKKWVKDYKK